MLTDAKLRSQVDALWDKLWTGGLANPLDAIEQISYLLFLKRLDDEENRREKLATMRGQPYEARIPPDKRWRYWTNLRGAEALDHLRDVVFPWFRQLGNGNGTSHTTHTTPEPEASSRLSTRDAREASSGLVREASGSYETRDAREASSGLGATSEPIDQSELALFSPECRAASLPPAPGLGDSDKRRRGSSFELYMKNAELKINKPGLLIEATKLIDQMQIAAQNQDVQGDLYEYLLGRLSTAGLNGQFRTPRHIIRMMVQMIDPRPSERIGDLAAGTAGFLVNAYQHILEKHTPRESLTYDKDGWPHNMTGEQLADEQRAFLQTQAFRGYDNDSGMTMLRIGSMNLMLHGIEQPRFYYMDTLSKDFTETKAYDVILMNPPFKGAVDKDEVSPTLPSNTTKSELLFLHLILRALDMGGRVAVIVPDGVLFGSSKAHSEIRRKIIEENRLEGVVSMPSGVFKPYAGVSTAILLFTRGGSTERVWFYDMEHDGFSLDDKRQSVPENDIPDILACWRSRRDPAFQATREQRLAQLREQIAPLKSAHLQHQSEINRLTFESVIASEDDTQIHAELAAARAQDAELQAQIHPLQAEINQLNRQFWVAKQQLRQNKYDLSTSRYRQLEQDEAYYERPEVTMERLLRLDKAMVANMEELRGLLR